MRTISLIFGGFVLGRAVVHAVLGNVVYEEFIIGILLLQLYGILRK